MNVYDAIRDASSLADSAARVRVVGDASPYPYAYGYFVGLMGAVLVDLNLSEKQLNKMVEVIDYHRKYEENNISF